MKCIGSVYFKKPPFYRATYSFLKHFSMDAQHDVYVVERKNGQYHFTLIQGVFRGIFPGSSRKRRVSMYLYFIIMFY